MRCHLTRNMGNVRYRDAELVRLEFGLLLLGPPPPPSPPPGFDVGAATGGLMMVMFGVNDETDMTIKRPENREGKDQL